MGTGEMTARLDSRNGAQFVRPRGRQHPLHDLREAVLVEPRFPRDAPLRASGGEDGGLSES